MHILIALTSIVALCQSMLYSQYYFYKDPKSISGTTIGHDGKYSAIPRNDNCGVTVLLKAHGSIFYGATQAMSGESAWIFQGDVHKRDIYETYCLRNAFAGGKQAIVTWLEYSDQDTIVYGSTRNLRKGRWLPEHEFQEVRPNVTPDSAGSADMCPPAGHLFKFRSINDLIDLGAIIQGEGIVSFVYHRKSDALYGISDHWKLFKFTLQNKRTKIIKDFAPDKSPEKEEFRLKQFGERLIVDSAGSIWGTGEKGQFYLIDTLADTIHYITGLFLPCIRGREQMNGVQSWVLGHDGIIYGGTRIDGILFSFDPDKRKCRNLGKPNSSNGMPGIAIGQNNLVYIMAGNKETKVHVVGYDAVEKYFIDYGVPHVPIYQYPKLDSALYSWRIYQAGPCFIYNDTTLVIGDGDRDGHVAFLRIGMTLPTQQPFPEN